jgi:hypothetical protein
LVANHRVNNLEANLNELLVFVSNKSNGKEPFLFIPFC